MTDFWTYWVLSEVENLALIKFHQSRRNMLRGNMTLKKGEGTVSLSADMDDDKALQPIVGPIRHRP